MLVVEHLGTEHEDDEAREDLVAFVRLTDGTTTRLMSGDTVPDDADEDHVKHLVAAGVLTEAPDAQVPSPPPAPRTRAPRGGDKADPSSGPGEGTDA